MEVITRCLVLFMLAGHVVAGQDAQSSAAERANIEAALAADRRDVNSLKALARLELQSQDVGAAVDAVRNGLRYSRRRADTLDFHALAIRIEVARNNPRNAADHYRTARSMRGGREHQELHLAMAQARIIEGDFPEATELLQKATQLPGAFNDEATVMQANLGQIQQASSRVDAQLALAASLSFGELAHLMSDMGLLKRATPLSAAEHDHGSEVMLARQAGFRSFQVRPGFEAGHAVDRGSFALLLEDLLHRAGKASLTRYIGSESPFSDLPSNSTSFNAVMTSVSRGLLKASPGGTFEPEAPVQAALAVNALYTITEDVE